MTDVKQRFDQFTMESYNQKYLSDGPLYQLLFSTLETCYKDMTSIIEVGSGPNAPACHFIQKIADKKIDYTLVEPSKSASELEKFKESIKAPSTVTIYNESADSENVKKGPKNDLVVSNRMIHEWRLYELSVNHEWTPKKAVETLVNLAKDNGKIIIADFCYCKEYANKKDDDKELIEDRERLSKRIGHSHPPRDYITPEMIKEAAKELNLKVIFEKILDKPEPDTSRIYWMVILTK